MKGIALALAALLLLCSIGLAARASNEESALDVVTLKDGTRRTGRVASRYGTKHVVLLEGTIPREIPKEDIAHIDTLRDRLKVFCLERNQLGTVKEEWKLVERARELGLAHMARVQAYHVLTLDSEHEKAHEFLGHDHKPRGWRWLQDKRPYNEKEFHARIEDWKDRFVLESEHWILETNTGVKKAVELLMDLERFYLHWMEHFAEELEAAEFVRDRDRKMVFWVLGDSNEKGIDWLPSFPREPYYSASDVTTTKEGNPNLAISFYLGGTFPQRFFDVAAQQIMYSMLVLGDVRGGLPPDDFTRHAHWVELGMGYWFGSQFGGTRGYAKPRAFIPDAKLKRDARQPGQGPLKNPRKELTNLVGMALSGFYTDPETFAIHRAKACSFFEFLIEKNPQITRRERVLGEGKEGLMCYLREVYRTPTAHSSSKFDDCLGAKIEELYEPWLEWLGR